MKLALDFKKLTNSEFVKNVVKLSTGTAVSQLITISASPILSRLYTPKEFGNFAIYNGVLTVLVVFSTLRYELGIVIARNKRQAFSLFYLSILLSLVFFVISLPLFFLLRETIVTTFNLENFDTILKLIPLGVLLLAIYQTINYLTNRNKKYSGIALSRMLQTGLTAMVAIIYGLFSRGNIGLVLGNMLGVSASTLLLLKYNKLELVQFFKKVNPVRLKYSLKSYKDFPLYSVPSAFLDTFSNQVPIFLITKFFESSFTGYYFLAYRVLSLPMILIGMSIGQVFYQKFSETYAQGGNCIKLLLKTWSHLAFIGIIPCLVIAIWGVEVFTFVLGSNWRMAGEIARPLSIMLFFVFISSPTSTALVVYRVQHYALIDGVISLIYRPLSIYIGYLTKDLIRGLMIFAVAEIIKIIVYNLIVIIVARKKRNELKQL